MLKWFKPGDQIALGMRHVFDFLNQVGMMSSFPIARTDGAVAKWAVYPFMEDALRSKSKPAIVSLRASMDRQLADGSTRHAVSVVFENGIFVNIPVEYPAGGRSVGERNYLLSKDSHR